MLSVKLHMDVFPLIGYDVFIVHRKNSHGIVQEGVASPVLVIACEQVCQQLHFRFFAVSEHGYQLVIHLASGGHIQSYGPDGYTGGIDKFKCPTLEFSYKNDDLGDPFINSYYALALGLATQEEIDDITEYAFKVNEVLQEYFGGLNIDLIDFKIEFGRYHGKVILADEISPDTCRLWDKDTHEKLDKDRFRRDLGNVEDAYEEVFRRLGIQ